MDVKKFTAVVAAMAMAGVISLAHAPVNTPDGLLTVSAATYLRLESSGDDVKQLQQNLITLNYMKTGSDTGTFDETTDGAVKNLQTDYNLKVDGIVGPDTLGLVQGLVGGTAKIVKVNETKVNVRTGAGTNGTTIITAVNKDQKLKYDSVETVGGVKWYKVSVGETQGYICGSYVSVVELTPLNATTTTTAANTTAAANATSGTLKVTGTILNVRSSTSTSSKKLTTVKNGQTFTYSNVKTVGGVDWYYIKVNSSTSGWVMGTFVDAASASETNGTLKVTGNILNVRSGASISAQKITELKNGETYTYSDVKNVAGINWYYIKVNSSTSGWVMGTYVSLVQATSSVSESGSLRVTGTVLNVRSSASTSCQKLTTLQNGESYTYSDTKTVSGIKWYYIRVNSSISGWVMGTYVSATPNTPASAAEEAAAAAANPNGGTLKIKGTLVNVRSGAGTENKVITQVKQNQNYTYTQIEDGWYYIKLSSSQSGWVMGDYVEAMPNAAVSTSVTASSAVTTTTAGTESGKLTVTGTLVNVRSGAGTENAVLTQVKQGESYTYTDKQNDWYYIQISATQSGWILGSFVNASANSTTTATSASSNAVTTTTIAQESGTLKITGDLVNVRANVGTDSAKITQVKQGETYTYTNKKNDWYYIQLTSTQSGWIMGDFVEATPNTTVTTTTTTVASTASSNASNNDGTATQSNASTTSTTGVIKNGTLIIAGSSVNVRTKADASSDRITSVKKGEQYTYTDVDGDWYYIQYSASKSGWILGSYAVITPNTETTKSTAAVTAVGKLTVTGTRVNIRSGPDASSSVITEAKQGETFEYLFKTDDWYYIQLASQERGWILATYVSVKPYPTTVTTTSGAIDITVIGESNETGTFVVTANKLTVRAGPGTSYLRITEIENGDKYNYIDVDNDWYCIQLNDTQEGWVSGQYVQATPDVTTTTAVTTASTSATTTTDAASEGNNTTEGSSSTESGTTTETTVSASASADETTTTTDDNATTVAGESTTISTEATTLEPTTTTTAATVGRKVTVGTVVVSKNLNVRSGAGTSYAKLGTLKNGATVVIVTKGSKWHKIEYGTGYGYVAAEYIKDIKTTYENVTLSYSNSYNYVNKGDAIDLSLSVSGATITYTSSDSVRCPISNSGIVTGKTEGLYTITAKSGNAVTTTCVVVLKEPYTDVQPMKISAQGTQFIADWEGGDKVLPTGEIGFFPYRDLAGYWTIGYGHAKTTTASKSWSEERAIAEFNKDIEAMIGAEYLITDERPYLTPEGATALLNADLNDGIYVQAVSDWAVRNGVKLTQTQFDALVSFCYNLGPSLWQNDNTKFYLKSAIISHRSGSSANADQVIEGFCRYMKSAGNNYTGLWYRRRNEAELFLEGDYAIDRENKFTLPSGITWKS